MALANVVWLFCKVLNRFVSRSASSNPVWLKEGEEDSRKMKDMGDKSANCFVWKMAVVSVIERNCRPYMCSKSWTSCHICAFCDRHVLAIFHDDSCHKLLYMVLYIYRYFHIGGVGQPRMSGWGYGISVNQGAMSGQRSRYNRIFGVPCLDWDLAFWPKSQKYVRMLIYPRCRQSGVLIIPCSYYSNANHSCAAVWNFNAASHNGHQIIIVNLIFWLWYLQGNIIHWCQHTDWSVVGDMPRICFTPKRLTCAFAWDRVIGSVVVRTSVGSAHGFPAPVSQ